MADFSQRQIKELRKLLRRSPRCNSSNYPEHFLLSYIFLEALVRLIGRYYRDRGRVAKKSVTHETLNIVVVKRSLDYFHIWISEVQLHAVWDSTRIKRGSKSARKLRDGLVHQWNLPDVEEVEERYDALISHLEQVLAMINKRVAQIKP